MSLKRINDLIQQGKNDEALLEIEQLPSTDELEYQIYKSIILVKKRDADSALALIDGVLNERKHELDLTLELGARVTRMEALSRLRRYPEIVEEIDHCEQLVGQMDDTVRKKVREWEGKLLSFKGGFQMMVGEIEKALDYFLESSALYEGTGNKQEVYYVFNNIGWLYRVRGDLDQALGYFQKQLDVSKEMDDRKSIAWSNYSIGYACYYKGDLKRAVKHANESLRLFEELEYERGLVDVSVLVGSIYQGKGEFDKSLDYYQKVLTKYNPALENQQTVDHAVCVGLRDIGSIRYYQNRIEESIEYYEKAINVHESQCKYSNTMYDFEIAILNYFLILSSIELEKADQLNIYLERIDQIADRIPNLRFLSKAGESLILKNKPRAKDKVKAQQLIEEALEESFDYQVEFLLQVDLCELLLDELRFYGEEEVIHEIQRLLTKISSIANNQRSVTSLVILYSLQAKLTLIEGNAELSNRLLTRALAIAEKKGLKLYAKKLVAQQNLLFKQLGEWKSILDANLSLQKKIEEVDLKNYITEAIKVREKYIN